MMAKPKTKRQQTFEANVKLLKERIKALEQQGITDKTQQLELLRREGVKGGVLVLNKVFHITSRPKPPKPPANRQDEGGEPSGRGVMIAEAKPIIEKDIADFLESRHLYHDLGRMAFWELHQGIQVNWEELKKLGPEKAAEHVVSNTKDLIRRLKEAISNAMVIKDLEESLRIKEIEAIRYVREIGVLNDRISSLETLYNTLTQVICDRCRQAAMAAIGLQFFSKVTGIDLSNPRGTQQGEEKTKEGGSG